MSNDNNSTIGQSFFNRVLGNDSLRKGVAALIAGAIVATISEALWPTTEH